MVVYDWSDYLDRHLKKVVEYAHCNTAPAPILVAQKSNSNKRMTNTSKNCKHSQIMHASFPHFVTSSFWSEVAVFQTSLISCLSSFFYYSTFGVLFLSNVHIIVFASPVIIIIITVVHMKMFILNWRKTKKNPYQHHFACEVTLVSFLDFWAHNT